MSAAREIPPDVTVQCRDAAPSERRGVLTAVLVAVLSAYFWPTIVAADRDHRQLEGIAAANLLFGWTGIGWLIVAIRARYGPQARLLASDVAPRGE